MHQFIWWFLFDLWSLRGCSYDKCHVLIIRNSLRSPSCGNVSSCCHWLISRQCCKDVFHANRQSGSLWPPVHYSPILTSAWTLVTATIPIMDMTWSEINHSFLFHGVIKILTACGMLRISIARCQIEAEIHSFPTMYIMGGGRYVRNGSNQWFCPKNRPQIMFFYWHISGSSNFGGVWDPKILKCRHFC